MPKTASKKPIKADKLLNLEKRGLAETMLKKKKRKTKEVKDT